MARSRGRKVAMFGMNSSDYEDSLNRSGLVFRPHIHHPAMILAFIVHVVTKRGVFGPDEFANGMGRFFPDGHQWPHFKKMLQMFDAHGVDIKHVRVFIGFFLSLLMFLRMLLGTDGAVRFMCALMEAALGTVEFEFDKSGEPVITYKVTEDGTQERDAWDSEFALYDLWSAEIMQRCINERELRSYLAYVQSTGASEDMRKVADATMAFAWDIRRDNMQVGLSYGGIMDAVSPVTLLGQLAQDAPYLFKVPHQAPAYPLPKDGYGSSNGSIYNLSEVQQWGDQHRAWLRSTLGGPAKWPLEGGTVEDLKRVIPEQSFGFSRPIAGGGAHQHSGLDLAAARGTPVLAAYPGRVSKIKKGWKSSDRDNNTPGWESGNFVVIDYSGDAPGGATFRHSYYHLDSVEALSVGDKVDQGQRIGTVGSTGNSTGPHLHLETAWIVGGGLKPLSVKALDPALVLRDGAINTARSSGVPISVGGTKPRPVLTLTSAALHGLAAGGHVVAPTGMPVVDPSILVRVAAAAGAQGAQAAHAAQGGLVDDVMKAGKKIGDFMYKDLLAPGTAGRVALQTGFAAAGIPPQATALAMDALAAAHDAAHKSGAAPKDIVSAMAQAISSSGVTPEVAAQLAKQAGEIGGYSVE